MRKTFEENCGNAVQARLYRIWKQMMSQCCLEGKYDLDVKVYERWRDFDNFYNWAVENGYEDMLSIKRINRSGNFEPSNCIFLMTSVGNCKNDAFVEFNGGKMPLSEVADMTGIPFVILRERYCSGARGASLFRPM